MTMHAFNLDSVDPSWLPYINSALNKIDNQYLHELQSSSDWLPGPDKIFNAFSQPVDNVNYVLFGESPYPRQASANGFAFWDDAVGSIWSPSGLDKKVNRATSLRNIIKMLLVANGNLTASATTQENIAKIDKTKFVATNNDLFTNFIKKGFLLLNATPVLCKHSSPTKDAKKWLPFTQAILETLAEKRPQSQYILLGNIANTIDKLMPNHTAKNLYAEHPYNISFIQNPDVLSFFKDLRLLEK